MIRSPSSEAPAAGSMFAGVRSSAGVVGALAGRRDERPLQVEPQRLRPVGRRGGHPVAHAVRERAGSPARAATAPWAGTTSRPAGAGPGPSPPGPRHRPCASWPPQPCTWTSMSPGAMNGPAAHAAFPAVGRHVRDPAVLDDQRRPGTTSSARTSRPSTTSAHRWPPRARPTWPGCSRRARWAGCCGRPRTRTRRPRAGRRPRRRTSARTSAGVPPPSTRWVSTPPPQNTRSRPNSRLSSALSMPVGGDLDGVEDVDADLDQVRDQLPDGAAAVEEDLARTSAAWMNENSSALERLDQGPVRRRREQRPVLAAQVVRLADDVHVVAQLRQGPVPVGELDLEDLLHHLPGALGLRGQVHVAVLEAAHLEQALGQAAADRADEDGAPLDSSAIRRAPPRPCPRTAPGSVASGHGKASIAAASTSPAERRPERVEVQPAVERHPAPRAPLVAERHVPVRLHHLAPVPGRRARPDEPHVAAEQVHDVRVDLGQLLGEVADADVPRRQAERRPGGRA